MVRLVYFLMPLVCAFALACGGGDEPAPTQTSAPTSEPSGETLAFLRDGNIRLVQVESGDERALPPSGVESFSWITANEIDAVTGTPNEAQRHLLVDLAGHVRELPFPAGGSWSREGQRYVVVINEQVVVFARNGTEVARLHVRPPVDTGPKPQNCGDSDKLFFNQPVFSADGQRILVAVSCQSLISATGGLYGVLQDVPFDGAAPRLLPVRIDVGRSSGARVAPEGGRIAVKRVDHASACGNSHGVILLEPDGTTTRELTVAAVVEDLSQRTPPGDWVGGLIGYDWSPQGDALVAAYYTAVCVAGLPPYVAGLHVLEADGSAEEKLADGPAHSPAWSPSGRYIAYVAQESFGNVTEPPLLRLFDLTTREVVELGQGEQPAWRPQP
jgi:dipeptidyl aminopeptidase/acylaminoacyl peptidase